MTREVIVFLSLGVIPLIAGTATPLEQVHASPDVAVDLSGEVVDDAQIANDDLLAAVTVMGIGGLPVQADLDAYHRMPNGDVLFSMDTAFEFGQGHFAFPGDILRFDGSSLTLHFASAAAGIPPAANLDALSVIEGGDLLVSFDIALDLDGTTVEDEDLARFDGAGFELFFDGSSVGVDAAQDLDAVHHLDANGHLLLSYDTSGTLGSVVFDDEDVLEFDPGTGVSALAYDGSARHPGWLDGDLDALHVVDASSGVVPNGGDAPGVPMRAEKMNTDIILIWDSSCIGNDADYAVYEGTLGDFTSHIPIGPPHDCTTAGATSISFTPGPDDRFYLVVPQGRQREGSYGTDNRQTERNPSPAACQPQLIGVCL